MAAAVVAVLCCGCSDNGIGGAFVIAGNGGNNECGKDRTAGSCRTVVIGTQTWMAENLNYKSPSGSWCYDDNESYCNIYGRLYDWSTAMGIIGLYNDTIWGKSDVQHQGICPEGWHLPSVAEWDTLVTYAGGSDKSKAGKRLKSTYGWSGNGDGTDEYGFSALPGGFGGGAGGFEYAGYYGFWWTATEGGGSYAYIRAMGDFYDNVNKHNNTGGCFHVANAGDDKKCRYAVRCVKDNVR